MHYVGVGVCIVGLVLLAISDVTQDGPGDTSGSEYNAGLGCCAGLLLRLCSLGCRSKGFG